LLCGDALVLLRRRILALSLLAWLPLLVLSVWEAEALGGSATVPLLWDVETHVRFLVTVPLLICSELVVHMRMRLAVQQFLERDLIPETARGRFEAAVASGLLWRNSVWAEVCLMGFEVIRTMRLVPFTKEAIVQLVVMTLAPVLPLTLTMLSVDQLLGRLLAVVF
jgi:hypothetical protein